ncbi:MAG: cytochrome c [Methylococcales bacterium]|nr:cytochrome c [Methylococcales bacterium]
MNSQAESKIAEKKPMAIKLPSEIKSLLRQEMQQLQHGMQALLPAIVSGDNHKITEIAKKMQHSYIMKQKLTTKQMQHLHKNLPPTFIQLDQKFHGFAGMLAHVAEENKPELISFYFYKLTETCVQCHSQYAQNKFPKLIPTIKHSGHH